MRGGILIFFAASCAWYSAVLVLGQENLLLGVNMT
jgi:hypothetical protein